MNEIVNIEGWALMAPQADGEGPRVRDLDIAERAGLEKPRNIRATIKANRAELEAHGPLLDLPAPRANGAGRPGKEFWLNEDQACALVILLRTPVARDLRVALVRLFGMARRGVLPVEQSSQMATLLRTVEALQVMVQGLAARNGELQAQVKLLGERSVKQQLLWTNRAETLAMRNLLRQTAKAVERSFQCVEGRIRCHESDVEGESWDVTSYMRLPRGVVPIVREMLTRYIERPETFVPAGGRRPPSTRPPRLRSARVDKGQQILFPRPDKPSA